MNTAFSVCFGSFLEQFFVRFGGQSDLGYSLEEDGVLFIGETGITNDFLIRNSVSSSRVGNTGDRLESLSLYLMLVRYREVYLRVMDMGQDYVVTFRSHEPPKFLEYLFVPLATC